MKKILFACLFLIFTTHINAQCNEGFMPSGFINFSDTNGDLHTLNNYLYSGKIVVLDFYLLTCGSCMASSPCIESLYQNYGQNNGDVIVLAMDVGDGESTDEVAIEWVEEHGMPNVPNFSQMGGTQNTPSFWGQFYGGCGENGGFAQSYVLRANLCCGDQSAINYELGCSAYCGDNSCCIYDENETLPLQGVTYAHQGGVIDCAEITNHIDNLLMQMLDVENSTNLKNKNIVKTINMLGKPVKESNNKILFDIYNDGTVIKKILLQ